MISFLDFTLPSMFSFTKVEMDVPENLPAAQDVSTESPPASLMIRFTGTHDLSSSPDTMKYVSAKSTVVRQIEFSSAPFSGYRPGSTFIGF